MAENPSLLIATPTHRGRVRREYTLSLLKLSEALRERSVQYGFCIEDGAVLHALRNFMASEVLLSTRFTHLLFIDDDMAFEPEAVLKLLEANKEVIGCAYPQRKIPFSMRMDNVLETASLSDFISQRIDYVGANRVAGNVKDGIIKVDRLGTGLTLISREALCKLKPCVIEYVFSGEVCWYTHSMFFGFFDYKQTENGTLASEDMAFCKRWSESGGELFSIISEPIVHIGDNAVRGRYADVFE